VYLVRGRTTAAVASGQALAVFWNGHATQRIGVVSASVGEKVASGINDSVHLRRATVRGTPGATVTPNIQNHTRRGVAPPSGVLLDLGLHTVQPTLETEPLFSIMMNAVIGGSTPFIFPGRVWIPPGAGLAMIGPDAGPVVEVNFSWMED
jgi:hypothetical protein